MISTLTPAAQQFIDSVLGLNLRLAVFDCDGTLWDADSGEQFFYWELERSILPPDVERWARARYAEYKAGGVEEEPMCGEMVTIHRGISCELIEREAAEFFQARIVPGIFPEMQELTRRLAESGCQMWAISSTNDWVVRVGAARFGIPAERVIAACVQVENGCATDRLVRVPTDERKAEAIRELLPRMPDAVFGNSMHDFHMMQLAAKAFAIKPNPDLEKIARARGWTIYQPTQGELSR
jgi:HAD superfamily phosphoserine phosphatase-like hydrolase